MNKNKQLLQERKELKRRAGINEEEAWASDGGYYNKPDRRVQVTRRQAQHIKAVAEEIRRELFDRDGVTVASLRDDRVKFSILEELYKLGLLERDQEEAEMAYWVREGEDAELVEKELDLVVDNYYDEVVGEGENRF